MPYQKKKPLIAVLVKRTVFFFFVMCILSIFLYGIGTDQDFTDISLLLLLRIAVIMGLFLGVGSIYGLALNLWLVFRRHKFRYLLGAGGYMLLGIFGAAVAVLGLFIITVAGGNVS
ncbi:MAG: hypothetical protein LBP76_00265 [Treponema sp.]|jgi:hypothetical protein|nr:hypothetical protein [Treponema sp.]